MSIISLIVYEDTTRRPYYLLFLWARAGHSKRGSSSTLVRDAEGAADVIILLNCVCRVALLIVQSTLHYI